MKNRHHLFHDKRSFKTPEAKELRSHPLAIVGLDIPVHNEYHALYWGVHKQPHPLVVNTALNYLDVVADSAYPVDPVPESAANIVSSLAYILGSLSLMDERIDVQRSAQKMQQLLLNQIPFLLEGRANYEL
jgi:hypothetical protein